MSAKKILNNQSGFSLIEVIAASAVALVMSLAVMKTNETASKGMRSMDDKMQLNQLKNAIYGHLLSGDKCTNSGFTSQYTTGGSPGAGQAYDWSSGAGSVSGGEIPPYAVAADGADNYTEFSTDGQGFYFSVTSDGSNQRHLVVGDLAPGAPNWKVKMFRFYNQDSNDQCHILIETTKFNAAAAVGAADQRVWLKMNCNVPTNVITDCGMADTLADGVFQPNEGNSSGSMTSMMPVIIASNDPNTTTAGLYVEGNNQWLGVTNNGGTNVNESISLANNQAITFGDTQNTGIYFDSNNSRLKIESGVGEIETEIGGVLELSGASPYLYFRDIDDANGSQGSITAYQDGNMYYDANRNNTATLGGHIFRADGATKNLMTMLNNGNVGIGTGNPLSKLDVRDGDLRLQGSNSQMMIDSNGDSNWASIGEVSGGLSISGTNDAIGTSHLFVHNNGRVGIGTTTPSTPLHVRADDPYLFLQDNNGAGGTNAFASYLAGIDSGGSQVWWIGDGSTGTQGISLYAGLANYYVQMANGSGSVCVSPTGNVGVGMCNATTSFQTIGGGRIGGNFSVDANTTLGTLAGHTTTINGTITSATSADIVFHSARTISGNNLFIGTTANINKILTNEIGTDYIFGRNEGHINNFTFTTPSDERIKKDIKRITSPTETIKKLKGYTYFMRRDEFPDRHFDDDRQYGVIAQEIKDILPELVELNESTDTYSVDYLSLIPILIEGFKEQQKQIEANIKMFKTMKEGIAKKEKEQDKRIEALEKENKMLREEIRAISRRLLKLEKSQSEK